MDNDHELSLEFLDLLDALTLQEPTPAGNPLSIRMAEVHFGGRGEGLARAIESARMTLVASLDGDKNLPDFDTMPEFDLVIANVPLEPSEWERATDYVMRFVRVRRPVAFVILGCMEEELRRLMQNKSQGYGYDVASTHYDELDFIAGVLERAPEEATWESLYAVVRRIRDEIAAGS